MALALDGHVTKQGQSGSSVALPALTTTAAGEIVVISLQNGTTVSSVTAAGLTFTSRASSGGANPIEEWHATSAGAQTSLVITVNYAASAGFASVWAYGVSGTDPTTPYDTNVSLPNTGATAPRTVSTSNANTFIIGAFRFNNTSGPSAGTGYSVTDASSGAYGLSEYKIVSSTQSSLSVTTSSDADSNGGIGDALQAAAGGVATINAGLGGYTFKGLASPVITTTVVNAGIGTYDFLGKTSLLSTMLGAKVGGYTFAGKAAPLSIIVPAKVGSFTYSGKGASLATIINAGVGNFTYSGKSSPLASIIGGKVGGYTFAGLKATLGSPIVLNATIGGYTMKGEISPLAAMMNAKVGSYTFSGKASPLMPIIAAKKGTYTVRGIKASFGAGGAGKANVSGFRVIKWFF